MELEYRRAVRLFPYDAGMTLSIADAYTRAGLCKPATDLFEWTFGVDPTLGEGRYQFVYCLSRQGRWAEVRAQALIGLPLVPARDSKPMRNAIAEADIALGRRTRPAAR